MGLLVLLQYDTQWFLRFWIFVVCKLGVFKEELGMILRYRFVLQLILYVSLDRLETILLLVMYWPVVHMINICDICCWWTRNRNVLYILVQLSLFLPSVSLLLKSIRREKWLYQENHTLMPKQKGINSLICRRERHCTEQLRMRLSLFYSLCDLLSRQHLLQPT